jgi:hypothetical protein
MAIGMTIGWRKFVSVVAIYAIALNTILWASLMPIASGANVDPFTVICHAVTQTSAAGEQKSPTGQPSGPSKACDHCSLCATTPASFDTLDNILAGYLEPGRLVEVLRPADAKRRYSVTDSPHLARGPPRIA